MGTRWIWSFAEGDGKNKRLLGGKGANLCEMTQIGIKVPPGFVVTTEACLAYLGSPDGALPTGVMEQARGEMARLNEATGKRFGDADDPLLVSVRSGSALSMPGMMDTILNLGLNEQSLTGLIAQTGDPRFGYDAYRRLIQLFGKVALGIQDEKFDEQFESVKELAGAEADVDLQAEDLEEIVRRFLLVVRKHTGRPFPNDPYEQLEIAIKAVFASWMGPRAVEYRREFGITSDMAHGTAANVVAMVFGRGRDSNPQADPGDGRGDARYARAAPGTAREARGALLRGAGLRVHERARDSLLLANARREDERDRTGQNINRDGRGGSDRSRTRTSACEPG